MSAPIIERMLRSMAREALDLPHYLAAIAQLGLHANDSRNALAIWVRERES